jgi:hypothetical protein
MFGAGKSVEKIVCLYLKQVGVQVHFWNGGKTCNMLEEC